MLRVNYEKPNIAKLSKSYTCVDPHMHTMYSDGKPTPRKLVAKAEKLGIGIGVTDHNEARGAIEACKIDTDTFVIPGIEVTAKEGCHILVYFYNPQDLNSYFEKCILPNKNMKNPNFKTSLPAEKVVSLGKKHNGVVCAPHPYAPGWPSVMNAIKQKKLPNKFIERFDIIEAMTGASLRGYNLKSSVLALNMDKPITGGTDAHFLFEMGKVVTCVKADDTESFLKAVLKKKSYVVGKEIDIIRRLSSHSAKVRLQMKHARTYLAEYATYTREMVSGKVVQMRQKRLENLKKMDELLKE